jgi:hypothetical protein
MCFDVARRLHITFSCNDILSVCGGNVFAVIFSEA